jgi:hypothetical protein
VTELKPLPSMIPLRFSYKGRGILIVTFLSLSHIHSYNTLKRVYMNNPAFVKYFFIKIQKLHRYDPFNMNLDYLAKISFKGYRI